MNSIKKGSINPDKYADGAASMSIHLANVEKHIKVGGLHAWAKKKYSGSWLFMINFKCLCRQTN